MSAIDAGSAGGGKRRPRLVWVISIFYFLSAFWMVVSYMMIFSGAIPLPQAQQRYFASLTMVDYTLTFTVALVNLLAAVLLLLLKRLAYYLFVTTFVLGMLGLCWQIAARHWLAAISLPGLIGALIGWGISIGIILYSRSLVKRGVLT